jgi:hypothetical protein
MDHGFGSVPVSYHDGYTPSQAWRDDVACVRLDSHIDGSLGGQVYGAVIVPFANERPDVRVCEDAGTPVSTTAYAASVHLNGKTDVIRVSVSEGRTDCTLCRSLSNGDVLWTEGTL